jgi:DUF4097 and DUF4098 domain-containing protein YvlB
MKTRSLLITTILVAIVCFSSTPLLSNDLKVIHEKTFKTEVGKNFKLNTGSGDVYISTWDKPEVYVKISGNKKAASKMKFKFDESENGIKIEGKRESWFSFFSWGGVYVKYEVKLPSRYNADVSTSGGDIKLYDLKGTVEFHTSGGDIFVKNIEGYIHNSTSGGDITVEDNMGQAELSTSGGDIHVKNFNGDLSASTSGGDILLEGRNGKVDASTSGGDIKLAYFETNKGIDLSSTGGDIEVKVPPDFSAYLDLSTTGGDVSCDLPVTSKGKISSSKMKGEINGGGPTLECSTTGGDITVFK